MNKCVGSAKVKDNGTAGHKGGGRVHRRTEFVQVDGENSGRF